jgi:geranylgeranyl reductase family protein
LLDVIVIGAGPAGSQTAGMLAGNGHSVLVLDRKTSPTEPVCCTGILGLECVSSFAITDQAISRFVFGATLHSPSGKRLKLRRPTEQAAIVDRVALNVSLVGRARGRGADFRLGVRVIGLDVTPEGVNATAVTGEGAETFQARSVVVASGFNPAFTEAIGLGKPSDSVMGAQIEVLCPGSEEIEVFTGNDVAPGFFAWLTPTSPGVALVGLLSRKSPADYLDRLVERLRGEGKIGEALSERLVWGIPLKPLRRSYRDRLLVVGTAAGQIKPTTGGGVYYGLLAANIAAGHLDRALKTDDLSARSLAGYERDWKRRLAGEMRTGYWGRRFYERMTDGQIDKMFAVVESSGILDELLAAEDLAFDWHGGVVSRVVGNRAFLRAMAEVALPAYLKKRLPGAGQ